MSDGYGTPANPFPELPPAASFYSVHWAGGAVKWPTMPFSYLEKSGAASPLLTDSYIGTASFWFRINGTMLPPEGGESAVFPLVYVAGPRFFDTYTYEGADHVTYEANVHDYGFYIWVLKDGGGGLGITARVERQIDANWYAMAIESSDGFGSSGDLSADVFDNKWGHIKLVWDFSAETGTITVNKVDISTYVSTLGFDTSIIGGGDPIDYSPSYVPWGETPRFFGARGLYSEVESGPSEATIGPNDSLSENHLISLAHVWVDTQDIITDAAKFVTAENKPQPLGPNGEFLDEAGAVIPGTKPEFYFKGPPDAFIENKGSGGAMTLIGEPPVVQGITVKIGT